MVYAAGQSGRRGRGVLGICERHQAEALHVEPLEFVAARMRGPDIMTRAQRLECAEAVQRVIARLERLRMPRESA